MAVDLPPDLARVADDAKGFLPSGEADALRAAAAEYLTEGGVMVEIGTYCGKSTVHLGYVAQQAGATLVTVDHHRGSEENQAGWEYHDAELVDARLGLMDTLPWLRRTLADAGLEDVVVPIVGRSRTVAGLWGREVDAVFIDGGHTDEHATNDYEGWAPWVRRGGALLIHDVFPDPADGGQAPYRVYLRALDEGYVEVSVTGSLRVLTRP